jgi:hypothetical protein
VRVADLLGAAVSDVDGGTPVGIAIVGIDPNPRGELQVSFDGGASWAAVGTPSASAALLLRADDLVRYRHTAASVPAPGTPPLRFEIRAWDGSAGEAGDTVAIGATGGDSAFSAAVVRVSARVTAENDAPRFADGSFDARPQVIEGGPGVTATVAPLAPGLDLSDEELDAAAGGYDGSRLTIERDGGSDVSDVFVATGRLGTLTAGQPLTWRDTDDGTANAIGTVVEAGAGRLVITFGTGATREQVVGAMRAIGYRHDGDAPPSEVSLRWTFDDGNDPAAPGQGAGGPGLAEGVVTVDIVPTNDAPVVVAPSGAWTAAGQSLVLGGPGRPTLQVADPEGAWLWVTLSASRGTLTLASTAGVSGFAQGDGTADARMVFQTQSGSLDTLLDGLVFTPPPSFTGLSTITVTATDPSGASVERSIAVHVGAIVVTNASDTVDGDVSSVASLAAGAGADGVSLREAILAANATPGLVRIQFAIPDGQPRVIELTAALPTITGPVVIDGTTDPSFPPNGFSRTVILDGGGRAIPGLVLGDGSAGSTVRGLLIRNVGGDGLVLQAGSTGSTVMGNWIGSFAGDGSVVAGRGIGGIGLVINASGVVAGSGSVQTDRNYIGNAAGGGVSIGAASTVTLHGNRVGFAPDGTVVGNGGDGIAVLAGNRHTIGGSVVGQGNFVSGSADDGISVSGATNVALLRNRAWGNGGLGIELGADDDLPVADDSPDIDGIPNRPTLTRALLSEQGSTANTTLDVEGTLQAAPNTAYRIEFFFASSGTADRPDARERLIASYDVTTDATGRADISAAQIAATATAGVPGLSSAPSTTLTVPLGARLTATATQLTASGGTPSGGTSSFASSVVVRGRPTVTLDGTELFYEEFAGAVPVDPWLEVSVDESPIVSATVRISAPSYRPDQDELAVEDAYGGITWDWNASTGTLTLTGPQGTPADLGAWIDTLRSVTYRNTSDAPSHTTRTIAFTVSDGTLNSLTATRAVSPVRPEDAPRPKLDGPIAVVPGQPTAIDVLANDSEPNGDPMTIVGIVDRAADRILSIAAGGTVTLASGTTVSLDEDGWLTVVQARGSDGIETFGYRVSDGRDNVSTGIVILATDSDGDGVPNRSDLDDDADGVTDAVERAGGGVPLTTAWLIDDAGRLVRVNGLQGDARAVEVIGSVGRPIADLAMAPDGRLWGVDGATGEIGTIARDTAAFTSYGALPADVLAARPNALAFDAAGRLYVAGADSSLVWRLQPDAPASALPWLDMESGGSSGDIVFSANAAYLAWTDPASGSVRLVEVFVDGDATTPRKRRGRGALAGA